MSTTDRTDVTSVVLTPEQALLTRAHIIARLSCQLDHLRHLTTDPSDQLSHADLRDVLSSMHRLADEFEAELEQIGWGLSTDSVTVTLSTERLTYYARQLMMSAREAASAGTAEHLRDTLREAEAGTAVFDQLPSS